MSAQPSQPSGDSQPAGGEERQFSTLVGSIAAAPADRKADADPPETTDRQTTTVRPTFTAAASGPAVVSGPGTEDGTGPGTGLLPRPAPPSGPMSPLSPGAPRSPGAPAARDKEETRSLPRPAPAAAPDPALGEPLLGDAAALRSRWQRVQADFVDDPQEAVGDAADLIEQTAQALVGALRQRQRQLRTMWERDSPPADGDSTAVASDTEHLRLMMQRYRALFNQLCRP